MHARRHEALLTKPGSGGRRVAAPFVAMTLVAMLAGGCGTPGAPGRSSTLPAATSTPAATPSPSPAYADTMTIGWSPTIEQNGLPDSEVLGFRDTGGGVTSYQVTLASVVYSGLYRLDARYDPVPDLADGPCLVPGSDAKVIRCHIISTTFHDGSPLTADDVAYTYQLLLRGAIQNTWGATGSLKDVRIVDPRTVDFLLTATDPTFLTEVLPAVPILPRHAVEAAYAKFVADTKGLRAADLDALAHAINAEITRDPPVCAPRLDAVTALLSRLGVRLYREDFSRRGTFDACAYMRAAGTILAGNAPALEGAGLDGVATAYGLLSTTYQPIGTGPYRFVSEDANRIHLEAWPGYHGGVAATRYLDFVPARGDGSDLVDGSVDIYQLAYVGSRYEVSATTRGVRIASPPEGRFFALQFNVRPGRLFADVKLRKALQLCIDLPRDVDAATSGAETPVYGPVMPGTWAYDPTLPRPARDTVAARKLIEAAGWRTGPDGVYTRGALRLAADIVVRADDAERVKIADLIALQARDCGMDLRTYPASWTDLGADLATYPNVIPGTKTPFDLIIGGWTPLADPADIFGVFVSSAITDAKHPQGPNYVGFADAVLDRLVAEAASTYDQAERAKLYQQAQQEVAAQLPYLFLWGGNAYDVVRSAVTTVDGPLDLTTPNWAWQPERMVVAASSP